MHGGKRHLVCAAGSRLKTECPLADKIETILIINRKKRRYIYIKLFVMM